MNAENNPDVQDSINDFARVVSYLWEINELIKGNEFGQIGLLFNELVICTNKTAEVLEISALDVSLMGLHFFGEYSSNHGIHIVPPIETIALIAAFVQSDAS